MSGKTESWTPERETELYRGMVQLVLSSRSTLYSIPALAAVAGNGGDKINKKTIQCLRKLGESMNIPSPQVIISETTTKGGRNGSQTPSPKKRGSGGGTPKKSAKKRKAESDAESEEAWEDVKPKMKPLV